MPATLITLLAQTSRPYRPFLDPLSIPFPGLHDWWWFTLVPLALFISLAYKAVRVQSMRQLPWQVTMMTVQIIFFMIAIAAAIQFVVSFALPRLG